MIATRVAKPWMIFAMTGLHIAWPAQRAARKAELIQTMHDLRAERGCEPSKRRAAAILGSVFFLHLLLAGSANQSTTR